MSWQENVRKVVPYTPGEQPERQDIIKLNTNENPYPPAPGAVEAIRGITPKQCTLYPDPEAGILRKSLADYYGLSKEQVFVGVGSDDVLALSFLTFFNSKKPVLFPDITYSFYDVWADVFRIPYETQPLREDFTLEPEDYKKENGGIIFPNPNAPTGIEESRETIEEIIRANRDVAVIVDEAYVDFGAKSALPLLKKYDNLLIVQTFSKSRSLAGLRIGYAMGNEEMVKYLSDVKFSFNSYTMNQPALYAGAASIADDKYFKENCKKIITTREWVKEELWALDFSFPDSMSNFIFATHKTLPAKQIFEALKKEGIYVRYFNRPRIDDYLRITIGTDEEMRALLAHLGRIIKES